MRPLSIHLSYTLHREGSEGCGSGSDSGRGSPQGTSPECQWACTQQPHRVKDTSWQYPHPANFLQAPNGATLCPRQGHKHCTFCKLLPNCSCWPSRPDEPSMTHCDHAVLLRCNISTTDQSNGLESASTSWQHQQTKHACLPSRRLPVNPYP